MTEEQWLASADPQGMFEFLRRVPEHRVRRPWLRDPSERKLWLLFFALDRHSLTFAPPTYDPRELRERRLMAAKCDAGELLADGRATAADVYRARHPNLVPPDTIDTNVWNYLRRSVEGPEEWVPGAAEGACHAFRDVLGNPFRPVRLPQECMDPDWSPTQWGCPWLTPAVKAVAGAVYAERRWEDLPVLADALEEAGCGVGQVHEVNNGGVAYWHNDAFPDEPHLTPDRAAEHPLLAHLRSKGPHYLDLCVTGKE